MPRDYLGRTAHDAGRRWDSKDSVRCWWNNRFIGWLGATTTTMSWISKWTWKSGQEFPKHAWNCGKYFRRIWT